MTTSKPIAARWHGLWRGLRRVRGGGVSAAILAVLAACGSSALAANGTWNGTNGSWSVTGNWLSNTIPGATTGTTNADTATFNTLSGGTITIDPNRNIKSLLFTGSTAGAFTIGSDGVNLGSALLLSSGGSITVNTTAAVTVAQTINAPLQIQSANGTYTFDGSGASTSSALVINGNVSAAASGTSSLTLQGSNTGTNTVSGVIGNGSATAFNLSKAGAGTWLLTGSNTYTGSTSVTAGTLTLGGANGSILSTSGITVSQGATLKLDNATSNNTDRVSNSLGIALNGGSLTFAINTSSGSFSETLGALNLGGGLSTVNTSQATTGQTSTLTFASLNRPAGAGINFAGTGLGTDTRNRVLFTSAPSVSNGIIGPWAAYNGSDYASYDATNGVVIANYTNINALGSTIADNAATNVKLSAAGSGGNITLGSATTSINTLLQYTSTAATVDTASKTLRIAGIMVGQGTKAALTIGVNAGDGTVTALTSGGELVLNGNNTSALTVNAVIADNGSASSVTKIGGNTVILNAANTYTGTTTVAQGTLQLGSSGTTGSITGPVAIYSGATLASSRTDASSPVAGGIIGLGGGITVNSGTLTVRPVAGSNSFGPLTLGNNARLVVNGDAASTNGFTGYTPGTGSRLEFAGGNNTGPGSWFQSGGKDNQAWYFTGGTTSLNANNAIAYSSIYGYALVADGGRLNLNQTGVGWGANSIGVLDVTGTLGLAGGGGGSAIYFGNASNAVGVFNQSKGSVVTTNAGIVSVGHVAGGRGEFNISGGTFGSSGGSSGNNAYNLTITNNATATGLVNLAGGSLYIRSVNTASNPSNAYLNFNGGTLVANQSITWTNTSGLITVYNGGATLDDGGNTLTISQSITAPTGYGVTSLPSISPTSGYVGSPYVFISGGSGTNATGVADYDPVTGNVTGIRLTNPGTGYQAGDTVTVWLRTVSGSTNSGTATLGQNVGGGLTKLGSGTLSLTGANTYTGTTAINAGILSAGVADVVGTSGALGNGGAIAFGGGTLRYTSASAGTDYSLRIRNSGSAIAIDTNAQSVTYTGVIDNTNTGGLALNDSNATKGRLTLSAANTFSGTTTVTSGTLRLSNSLALQNSVLSTGGTGLIFDSAVSSRAFTIAGLAGATNLALADSGANAIALSVGNGDVSSSYSGALSGAGSLVKIGTGTLTLSGNNSHSGGTTISAGTLLMSSSTALGASTGALAVNGGTLDMNGFSETVGALSGSSGAVITSVGAATLTGSTSANSQYNGIISGAVALTKQGAGTLTLGGVNTYTGTTTIAGGTLALGSGASINASSSRLVISSAARLQIGSGATVTTSGAMSVTGTGAIYLESGGSFLATQSGGSVAFVPDAATSSTNAGILTSSGALGTSGTMIVNASYFRPAAVNNSRYTFTVDNAIVSATASTFEVGRGGSYNTVTLTNGAQITASAATVAVDASYYTLNINAGSTLALRNNGTLSLKGGNGSNETLNIDGGTISGAGALSFGGAADSVVSITNSGLLSTNADSTLSATNALVSISGAGSHWNMNGKGLTLGGSGVESNTVRLSNGGQLTTGSLSIAAGGNVLEFDGGILASATTGTLVSGAGTVRIKSGGATVNTGSFASTISSNISEDTGSTGGGLTKLGASTLTLSGSNSYTGATTISAGTLSISSAGVIGSGSYTGAISIASGATLNYASSAAQQLTGIISGSGGLRVAGTGAVTLSGANTFSGGIAVTSGTLLFGASGNSTAAGTGLVDINGGALGSSGATSNTITSGSFRFSSDFTAAVDASGQLSLNVPMTLANGTRTITVSTGQGFNLYGGISDDGNGYGLIKAGPVLMRLAGVNTYTGDTRVNEGSLTIYSNLAAQYSTLDTDGAGTFNFTGLNGATTPTIGGFKGSKNQSIGNAVVSVSLNPAASVRNMYSGVLSGSTSIIMIGSGTQVFSGANTYTGTTDVRAGTLQIGNSGTTGRLSLSSAITGSAGGTLAFNRTNAVTQGTDFTTAITGGLGVAQLGSGTLVLNGANSYTGPTTVSAGFLRLDAADAIPNQSNLLVNGGGLNLNGNSDTVAAVTITSGSIYGNGTLSAATYGLGGGRVAANLGAGTLTVMADSALDGFSAATAVNLNAGALSLGSGGRFTASSVAVSGSSGASLTLGGNEAFGSLGGFANVALGSNTLSVGAANTDTTYSGVVSGAGGLTKVGSGVFTLANANTYSGPTQVTAGTLLVGAANAIASTSAITLGSASSRGILEVDHDLTISSLTFSGSGGDISEGSAGMVTLSAASGPATITVLGGSNAFHANATLASPTVVDVANGAFFSFHNDLSGDASLTKQGLGTMALVGVNEQLSGNFFITAGRVNIGGGYKQIGTGTTTVSGGATLDLNGHAFTNTINLISGTILNQGNSAATTTIGGTSTISGAIEGIYDINSGGVATFASGFGTGTSTVDVNVNAGGRATFNGGVSGLADVTVNAGGRATFENTVAGVVVSHGTSTFNGALLNGANAQVHGGLATFAAATAAGSTVSVQSAGSAVFSGGVAGLVDVMGSATFDSTSDLTGRLYTSGSGSGGVATLDNVAATITGELHNDGQLIVNGTSGSQTISGYIHGTGSLLKQGAGVLVLSGANTYSGGTWIDGGTLTAGHVSAFGTGVITLGSGATLDLNNLLVTNAITNNGGTIRGGVISGTTSVSGNTTLDGTVAGTVTLTNNSSATIGGNVTSDAVVSVVANSTVTAAAGSSFAAGSTISNLGQFIVNASGTTPFAANMSGNGAFLVNGGGKVQLTGSNAGFSGETTVSGQGTTLSVNSVLGGDVLVGAGASLGGSGLIAGDIGGDGLIGPGNSPGILTVNGQLAATGSTAFAFELSQTGAPNWSDATNSSNDVLRLTASSPFASSLASTNVVNVYFDVANLNNGDTFLGGFFVDNPASTANLLTSGLGTASFQYFVYGDGNGGYVYNGINYYSFDDYKLSHSGITGVTQSVVNVASADFSGGSPITTGQVTQFVIIPEPDTIIFAGIGIAMAGWSLWKRRRTP